MEYRKQHVLTTVVVTSIIFVGMISSVILSLPIFHEVLAQTKTGQNIGMMNGTRNGNMSMMKDGGSGMNTGSMNVNMTMDQMLDMMDMMHNMMMNTMRMMVSQNAGMMNSSSNTMDNMNMDTNMNTKMQ